ncbi:hypothetical protein [Longirhabdus pacifica]|uniref:hypothetical protein n=1 Tax=Longirhabdus pacifica TaxID=2305227 RepID=UPI00100930BB|nr:hypothetical protein [Longirhabdus pacifica]
MVTRKKGIINGIIYDHTVYHDGKYRMYPSIIGLRNLVKRIIESGSTTEYIRFNPFYRNAKINRQIELDEYMFYMECREQFDGKDFEEHIGICLDKPYIDLSDEEIRWGKTLYPLCRYDDVEGYKKALETYDQFLFELIPKLMEMAKYKMDLKDEDLAFGYFCFEVHSG